ncbi:MAG: efflux RND transporter periplasmic adaptor subunit [Bacteroidales bacterium]|nr:efflux RND transporter periplasmic adaptor subunit [Bacteroidales bacterium]
MKKTYVLLLAAVAMAVTACGHKDNDELSHHHHHAHEHAEEHEHGEHEGHDHEHEAEASGRGDNHSGDEIVLSHDTAERFGVKTDTAAERQLGAVVKVGGRILPSAEGNAVASAPTSGILALAKGINVGTEVRRGQTIGTVKASGVTGGDPNRAARVELDAAKAELDRVKPLYEDHLVTRAQYNAAVAAYERAKAAYSAPAASGAVVAAISGVITSLDAISGEYVATGAPVANIAASGTLTLQADVPARLYGQVADAADARIVLPYGDGSVTVSELGGRRLSSANTVAAGASGYVPLVFTLNNDGRVVAGTPVEVYLLGKSDRKALAVPVEAVTEQQGNYYVFVRLDDDCYSKVQVRPGSSDGRYVEILSGLHGGEAVVSAGVTAVRLAQSSGNVPEGHSHSH